MKDFIVSIYDSLLQLLVLVSVGIAFLVGWLLIGGIMGNGSMGFIAGLLFGVGAFVIAAAFAGYFFTQLKIKDLLQEQVDYLRELSRSASHRVQSVPMFQEGPHAANATASGSSGKADQTSEEGMMALKMQRVKLRQNPRMCYECGAQLAGNRTLGGRCPQCDAEWN
jgi:predicted Zn-ribbon and HTH transcriptional regulator